MAKGSMRGIPTARAPWGRKTRPLGQPGCTSCPPPAPATAVGSGRTKRLTFGSYGSSLTGVYDRAAGLRASGRAGTRVADGAGHTAPWPGLKEPSYWAASAHAVAGGL